MLDPESEDYVSTAYILDVRTPAEWYWVGHPGKDKCGNGAFFEETVRKVINIPWNLWEYVPQDKEYKKIPNRFFNEEVVRQFAPGDTIIIMCRSGKRSVIALEELEDSAHPACKRLEELGYYSIYNMLGSPYKAMQVWKYRPVLLCNRLIFHHVLPEAIICN
jgi:rhodanese-related sulfurtransferase